MEQVGWLLKWVFKVVIFFTLFAFALNNQEDAVVHLFFGTQWRAPLVLIVFFAFALGLALGILAMLPRWWRKRRPFSGAAQHFEPSTNVAPSHSILPPHGH